MQNKHKNTRQIKSEHFLLSAIVLALSVQGCAHQEKKAVNVPAQPVAKVEQQPAVQPVNPAPPPKPFIERYALDRLKQMSATLASAKAASRNKLNKAAALML
jgi:hypothetical protein